VTVSNNAGLNTSGAITASGILSLATTANNGNVGLGGNVFGTTVDLSANGSGTIGQTAGTIAATNLNLTSGSGNITTLSGTTSNLTFNTSGNVTWTGTGGTALNVGNGSSTGNNVTVSNNAGLNTSGAITASGILSLSTTTGSNGSITLGANAAGTSVTFTTSTLTNNSSVTANTGNLSIQSNGTSNALTINLGSGSSLTASLGNVNFNTTNAGSVTVQPASGSTPLGSLSANGGAGNINLNIGSGSATVAANSIAGTVQDPNSNFSTPAAGNVSITANTGSLIIGNFATTSGNSIAATTNASNGNITTAGNLTAGTLIALTGGSSGIVTITSGNTLTSGTSITSSANSVINSGTLSAGTVASLSGSSSITNSGSVTGGTAVNITTPTLNNDNSITATTGDIAVQSNGTNNILAVNLGNGAIMTATAGNIAFNNTTPGQIIISGGSNNYGTISANNAIILNAGSSSVNVSAQQLIGCVEPTASSVSIQTQVGALDFCNGVSTASNTGSGGVITIIANGGAININDLNSSGTGLGNTAGAINITASNGITFTNINANGNNGAGGATVTISSTGQAIVGNYISSTGTGGNGGNVTTSSNTLVLTSADSSGNSVDTLATGSGNGGTVSITTTSPLVFTIGNGAGTGNGTGGSINASGVNGGFVTITSYGNSTNGNQVINGSVIANGTTGNGGNILFQGEQPAGSAPLTTTFTTGSLVQATNNADDSGLIGFNAGVDESVNLDGTGTVHAGNAVRIGALNPSTMGLLNVAGGTVNISSGLTIGNQVQTNGFIPPPPPFPSGPTQSPSSGPLLIASLPSLSGAPGVPSSLTATDQTQVLGFINLNLDLEETDEDNSENSYTVASTDNVNIIPGTTISAFIFGEDEIDRLARDRVAIAKDSGNNYLNLQNGNILLTPDRDILVGTTESRIYIGSGATVFIMKSDTNVVVYDLIQTRPKQVSVVVNRQRLVMEPGIMFALTKQNIPSFENMKPNCRTVAYRQAQQVDLYGNVKVFTANFSITSAMTNIQPLRRLAASPYKRDQLTMARLWKSAQIGGDLANPAQAFQNASLGR